MSVNLNVDHDKLDIQMGILSGALNNVPEYDCTLEPSPMGSLQSQIKCAELSAKMQQLIKSYKQLMTNSVMKAYSAASGYKKADEILTQNLINATAKMEISSAQED